MPRYQVKMTLTVEVEATDGATALQTVKSTLPQPFGYGIAPLLNARNGRVSGYACRELPEPPAPERG